MTKPDVSRMFVNLPSLLSLDRLISHPERYDLIVLNKDLTPEYLMDICHPLDIVDTLKPFIEKSNCIWSHRPHIQEKIRWIFTNHLFIKRQYMQFDDVIESIDLSTYLPVDSTTADDPQSFQKIKNWLLNGYIIKQPSLTSFSSDMAIFNIIQTII